VDNGLLIALLSAFGVKEIWSIVKKKMDQNEREGDKLDQLSLKVIDELKNKIEDLESKIDELILENTELKIKVARMEERLLKDVTKRTRKKRNAKPNP